MIKIDINKRTNPENYSMSDFHSHNHFEIYFLSEGSRLFFLQNNMYEISAPTLMVIPPDIMHKTEGEAFTRYNVFVSPKELNPYQLRILNSVKMQTIKPSKNEAKQITDMLEDAINIEDKNNSKYIKELIFSGLLYTIGKMSAKPENKPIAQNKQIPSNVIKIISYMYKNYTENITLEEISQKFYISKSTLNYNFKKGTGLTPIEYLIQIRLTKAKELLLTTEKSIREISEMCGFSSPNYFGLIFKKYELISPTRYRNTDR